MNDEIVKIVREGLNGQNLERLVQMCEQLFDKNPTLYWPLAQIFRSLADEYDDQGIPMDRYEAVNAALKKPLLALLTTETTSHDLLLTRMNEVLRAFEGIGTIGLA